MEKAIETPHEGKQQLSLFLMNRVAAIPDDVRDKLTPLAIDEPSPVVASVQAAELVYARREELPVELLELGAQLAAMCANFNFHGLRNDNRGYAMAATLRAMPGVSSEAPPASELEAPEPSPVFAPAPDAEAPPEPAEVVTPVPAPETGAGEA